MQLFSQLIPETVGEKLNARRFMNTRPSPLQNKVNPLGDIEPISTREATLMGNRGVLHNSRYQVTRKMVKDKFAWIYCKIEHDEGERRVVMTPGCYTELFFLDEATALAAGHRPCSVKSCLKLRHEEFKEIWYEANANWYSGPRKFITPIDAWLHKERIDADGNKIGYFDNIAALPNGAFVKIENKHFVVWDNKVLEWSFNGYLSASRIGENQEVKVLTPRSVVRCLGKSFEPRLHLSAHKYLYQS
jgi:hypothetical protein